MDSMLAFDVSRIESRRDAVLRVHFDVAAAVDWLDNADRLFATADIAKRGSTMDDSLR